MIPEKKQGPSGILEINMKSTLPITVIAILRSFVQILIKGHPGTDDIVSDHRRLNSVSPSPKKGHGKVDKKGHFLTRGNMSKGHF